MIWISSKKNSNLLCTDAFNQQLQSLINKYPQIQKNMKSEFIAYYDKEKNRETVKNYAWNLQKSINDIMQSYPSTKFVQFYKDDVSPSMVDGNGRLKSDTNVISIEGGKYDENK